LPRLDALLAEGATQIGKHEQLVRAPRSRKVYDVLPSPVPPANDIEGYECFAAQEIGKTEVTGALGHKPLGRQRKEDVLRRDYKLQLLLTIEGENGYFDLSITVLSNAGGFQRPKSLLSAESVRGN